MTNLHSASVWRGLSVALLAAAFIALGGCNIVGYVSQGVAGDGKRTYDVDAEYTGLEGKRVAVIVAADEMTLFAQPGLQGRVCRAVTAQLGSDIVGIQLTTPEKVTKFQFDNTYWNTLTYGDLLKRLDVDRLVYIDLSEYSTHEPGNKNVWQGTILGSVSVAAADAVNPNDLVYTNRVSATFPEDARIGVLDANDDAIQTGMLRTFSQRVSALFHDTKVKK